MAQDATQVVVAGTGAVYVAPEGTVPPVDLAAPAAAWLDVGYISEDGVTFTVSRESEDINAWQSAEPVRVVSTSEPKTIAFELLQFEPITVQLAFRGGTISPAGPTMTYTPPDAGASDVRSMIIDGIDGDEQFRFIFSRVQIQGDVEWNLVRTNAIRLPLEFGVLAPSPGEPAWQILTDSEDWGATVALNGNGAAATTGNGGTTAKATTAAPAA